MTSSTVLRERRPGGVEIVTLNRPQARNALSRELVADLAAAAQALSEDPEVRAVVITGSGEHTFCAGADLIERQTMSGEERTAHTAAILAAVESLAAVPVPVIAAIRGYALAGGAELALACDLRIGSEEAVLGFPEVRIGIFPGAGGVVRLPRVIGPSAANDLLFTGRQVAASEALRLGLLDGVVHGSEVMGVAVAKAEAIAANAPLAIRALKAALRESNGMPIAAANEIVGHFRRPLDHTEDYAEGLRAFAEKRAPIFTGG